MRHYCTYFDSNYLLMGLALYRSLQKHSGEPFTLWVLCFDDEAYRVLQSLAYPEIRLISLQEFEAGDSALLQAKQNRSKVEYYWTCTPSLPLYVLENHPEVDLITYLDADMFFFSNPAPVFAELGQNSIGIISHRFHAALKVKERYGIYNVSIMCFRRDENGLAALRWWRERCNEWCYNRLEDDKYGDQKYLDDWLTRFKQVVILEHKGVGFAPWNLSQYQLSNRDGRPWVDNVPLVVYHFHNLRLLSTNIFAPRIHEYLEGYAISFLTPDHIRYIYHPYASCLRGYLRQGYVYGIQTTPWVKLLQKVLAGRVFLIEPEDFALWLSRLTLMFRRQRS